MPSTPKSAAPARLAGFCRQYRQPLLVLLGFALLMAVVALLWQFTPLAAYDTPEKAAALMADFRDNPRAPFIMVGVFIVAGICFFPLTILTVATAMTFGAVQGILISLAGSLCSAALLYGFGHFVGGVRLRRWLGPVCEKIQGKLERGGAIGIMALRFVMVVPFSVVNMSFGIVGVAFVTFMAGTFLALLPGAIIRAILGDAIMEFWNHPDPKNIAYLAAGLAGWIAVIAASHFLARRLQQPAAKLA